MILLLGIGIQPQKNNYLYDFKKRMDFQISHWSYFKKRSQLALVSMGNW